LGYLIGDSFLSPKILGAPAFFELDPKRVQPFDVAFEILNV
jgi:hypothetical protein